MPYTVKNVPVFVPVFLYAVTMFIFQIKRIISSEKWFNYVVTSFFLFKMTKIWVGRTTLNGEKKEDGLSVMPAIIIKKILLWLVLPDGICLQSS